MFPETDISSLQFSRLYVKDVQQGGKKIPPKVKNKNITYDCRNRNVDENSTTKNLLIRDISSMEVDNSEKGNRKQEKRELC